MNATKKKKNLDFKYLVSLNICGAERQARENPTERKSESERFGFNHERHMLFQPNRPNVSISLSCWMLKY